MQAVKVINFLYDINAKKDHIYIQKRFFRLTVKSAATVTPLPNSCFRVVSFSFFYRNWKYSN